MADSLCLRYISLTEAHFYLRIFYLFDILVKSMNQTKLTESQRRYLRSCLISFEKALRHAAHLIEDKDKDCILYCQRLNLSYEQRQLVHNQIDRSLLEIKALVEALGIEVKEENSAQIITAEMSISWSDLVDGHSSRLKGYGEVNPDVAAILDPAIDRLAMMAMELSNLVTSESNSDISKRG